MDSRVSVAALDLHQPDRQMDKPHSKLRDFFLILIGAFKLIDALLLVLVAIGTLNLLHKDVAREIERYLFAIRLDPENRLIHQLLEKLLSLDAHDLEAIGAGSLVYAVLLSTEGIGLLLRKRWAEYFTVLVTGSFIPFESYELVQHVTVLKVVVAVINVAIVAYLIVCLVYPRTAEHR